MTLLVWSTVALAQDRFEPPPVPEQPVPVTAEALDGDALLSHLGQSVDSESLKALNDALGPVEPSTPLKGLHTWTFPDHHLAVTAYFGVVEEVALLDGYAGTVPWGLKLTDGAAGVVTTMQAEGRRTDRPGSTWTKVDFTGQRLVAFFEGDAVRALVFQREGR